MKILIIGGSGIISDNVRKELAQSHQVYCMTRNAYHFADAAELHGDINDYQAVAALLKNLWFDAVLDFVCFTPEQAEQRACLFEGKCGRYFYISTCTAYEHPHKGLYTSDTPLINRYSAYGRAKAATEEVFMKSTLHMTVVRPYLTYGDTMIPFILRPRHAAYTLVQRFRRGEKILIPGDGLADNTCTHAEDFARGLHGLLLNPDSIGARLHITQDEHMNWIQMAELIAEAAGAPKPALCLLEPEHFYELNPQEHDAILGDKAWDNVFDNSDVRKYVPGFEFRVPMREGLKRTIKAMDESHAPIDPSWDLWCERMIAECRMVH